MKSTNELPDSTNNLSDERVLEGVSEEIILKKYMESMNCEWRHHDLRHKIRETSLFQLHLACVRFNEALRNLLAERY